MPCVVVVNSKSLSKSNIYLIVLESFDCAINIVIIVGAVSAKSKKDAEDADVNKYAGEVFFFFFQNESFSHWFLTCDITGRSRWRKNLRSQ